MPRRHTEGAFLTVTLVCDQLQVLSDAASGKVTADRPAAGPRATLDTAMKTLPRREWNPSRPVRSYGLHCATTALYLRTALNN